MIEKLHPSRRPHVYGVPDSAFYPSDIRFEMWNQTYAHVVRLISVDAPNLVGAALNILRASCYTATYEALDPEALSEGVRRVLRDGTFTYDGDRGPVRIPSVNVDDPDAWGAFAAALERGRDRLVRFAGERGLRTGNVPSLLGGSWRARLDELEAADAAAAAAERQARADAKRTQLLADDKARTAEAKKHADRARGKDGA